MKTETQNMYMAVDRWVLILLLLLPAVVSAAGTSEIITSERILLGPNDTQRCLKCHGMANFTVRDSITLDIHSYAVDGRDFNQSIHGKLNCSQCHANITQYPHAFTGPRTKVTCTDDCHAVAADGRPYDHRSVGREFSASVHGRTLGEHASDNPTCLTCHGNGNAHTIRKAKGSLAAKDKMALCISCHDNRAMMVRDDVDPDAVASYRKSFHFKAIRFGDTSTAVCQDCHSVHHVLPRDSVASTIAVGNIAKTCGRDLCHPGAKMNFAMSGANHLSLRMGREPFLRFEEEFFIFLTAGSIAMLIIGIILDIQRKFGWTVLASRSFAALGRTLRLCLQASNWLLRFAKKVVID